MANKLLYLLLSILFAGIYLFRFYTLNHTLIDGSRIRIIGFLSQDPLTSNNKQKLVIDRINIYTDPFPEYQYGQKFLAEGILQKDKYGRWILPKPTKIEKIQDQDFLNQMRSKILENYKKFLPEPHASLLSGIVLGTKTSLDSSFFNALRNTGTLHIIVASGTNISLFAGTFLTGLSFVFGRRRAIIPALLGIWVYVFLVGFQAPIVRAGIMGSLAFAAQAWGREFDSWRALFASGALLLIINPLWLFDVSFQLSFAATAGILWFSPVLTKALRKIPEFFRQDLATSLSAQMAVSPIIFFSFGSLSLISPFVNILVLWTVPTIMALGMAVGLLGLIFEPAGQAVAWFAWIPLEYFIRIVRLFG